MKNTLQIALCIFTVLLIYAYSPGNKTAPARVATAPITGVKDIYADTLNYNGKTIYLEPIKSNEFINLPGPNLHWIDAILPDTNVSDDKQNVVMHDTIVTQKFSLGDIATDSSATVLTLKFQNGKSKQLLSANLGEPVGYIYLGQVKELNSHLVCHYYEQYFDYALFNKATGKEDFLCGYPFVSPDKKTICCYHVPCDECPPGFACSSEFLVYSIESDSIKLQWEAPVKWEPVECKWKDNLTLYMKIREGWDEDNSATYFVKLQLPGVEK